MGDIGKKEPEDTNEKLDVEMSDLNASGSANAVNNHKRSMATQTTAHNLPKPLFFCAASLCYLFAHQFAS